jgi:hypothetical protein
MSGILFSILGDEIVNTTHDTVSKFAADSSGQGHLIVGGDAELRFELFGLVDTTEGGGSQVKADRKGTGGRRGGGVGASALGLLALGLCCDFGLILLLCLDRLETEYLELHEVHLNSLRLDVERG